MAFERALRNERIPGVLAAVVVAAATARARIDSSSSGSLSSFNRVLAESGQFDLLRFPHFQ